MSKKKKNSTSSFTRFLKHPIFIAFMGALFGTILGAILTFVNLKNSKPIAKIVPANVTVDAAENITFDAQGSYDPDGGALSFEWTVNGHQYDQATIASCDKNLSDSMLNCRFATPGTHIVSVSVIDAKNAKTTDSSSVKVKLAGGYIGIVLQFGSTNKDTNLIRAFNYAVDWPTVQTLLRGKPIVLYDPDNKVPVFAVDISRSLEKAKKYAKLSSNTRGLKFLAPVNREAADKIVIDLAEAGIAADFVQISIEDVYVAMERGLSNSGLIPLSGIDELAEYY